MIRQLNRKRRDDTRRLLHKEETLLASSFERDCRTLESGMLIERVLAVRRLARLGAEAFSPLCRALEDPCTQVRIATADALGDLSDPRAVPALHAALRRSLLSGSDTRELQWGRLWRWIGPVSVTVCVVAIASHALHSLIGTAAASVLGTWVLGTQGASRWRRGVLPLQCSLVNALHQIAAANDAPEVRVCLPELEALAETGWLQARPGAPALTDTLQVVRSLRDLSSYPLPATDERTPRPGLPLAAEADSISAGTLPMPADDGGSPA